MEFLEAYWWTEKTIEEIRNLILIAVAAIALPLAIWRSWLTHKQARLSENGQNFDRYQKGAAMLGDARMSVRQAGAMGLRELAKQQPKKYNQLILEILCTFVRDRGMEQSESEEAITPDIRSTMYIVSTLKSEKVEWEVPLFDAHLVKAKLSQINLSRANLTGANLRGADFREADFRRSNLFEASLVDADFREANFSQACLRDADLTNADLRGAALQNTELKGANLKDANLEGLILNDYNLGDVGGLTSLQLSKAKNFDPHLMAYIKDIEKTS